MGSNAARRLAAEVLERVRDDVDTLRDVVDMLDRHLEAGPLERTMRLWGISRADLGRMFGVSRQAISQWVAEGPPPSRAEQIATLGKATDVLDRWVKRDRIASVVRRPVEGLEGRSRLEVARAGEFDRLHDELQDTFDLARIAP